MKRFKEFFNQENNIFYHGTNEKFDVFSRAYVRGQLGFHFGTLEQAYSIFGDEKPKYIIKAKLHLQNPLRLEDLGSWYGYEFVNRLNLILGSHLSPSAGDNAIVKTITDHGYDGIVYENKFETEGESYIAFFPKQIEILAINKA